MIGKEKIIYLYTPLHAQPTKLKVEPRFNEFLDITNNLLQTGKIYSKIYGTEPRYNEFLIITNIIREAQT